MLFSVGQQALHQSQDPHFIDHLLEVLNLEGIGKVIHAERIRKVYSKKKAEHKPCGKYRKGITEHNLIKLCLVTLGVDVCNLCDLEEIILFSEIYIQTRWQEITVKYNTTSSTLLVMLYLNLF